MRSRDVIELYNMIKVGARVQIIDTTQNEAIAANIVHAPTVAPVPNLPVPAAVSAAVAANGAKPAVATPTPAVPARKQWAGAPTTLLAKQTAVDKAKARPPVGAPPTARPVSNNAPPEGSTPGSSNTLGRPVLDSL